MRMVGGCELRLRHIMRDGKMLCIPMDHGISNGPIAGIEDPHSVISSCDGAGLTSIIINKGIIRTLQRPPNVGILVHFSASTSLSPHPNRKMITGTVEEAVRLGADGVSLHINVGGKEEPEMLEQLGATATQCHEWGMPLLAMMYPRGENVKNPHDAETVAHASRIGAECGADIVKTLYTGDPDSFRRVIKSTPVPVVIAGGPKAKTDAEILTMTSDAMGAGAAGVTFGRNIFAHSTPSKMVAALADIIFDSRSAAEAAERLV